MLLTLILQRFGISRVAKIKEALVALNGNPVDEWGFGSGGDFLGNTQLLGYHVDESVSTLVTSC